MYDMIFKLSFSIGHIMWLMQLFVVNSNFWYFPAVEFLWNCTVESLKMLKEDKTEGAGCILAHCMGLGKTLSVSSKF